MEQVEFVKGEKVVVARWNRMTGWWFHTAFIDKVNKVTYKVEDTLYNKHNLQERRTRDIWNQSTNEIMPYTEKTQNFIYKKREEQMTEDFRKNCKHHIHRLFKVYNQGDVRRMISKMLNEIEEEIENNE